LITYGQHWLDDNDIDAIVEVLKLGPITQGQKSKQFGAALAKYSGSLHGIAVSTGTAALHLAVKALGIGPGDEVITTPMTFCATANVVIHSGADVCFADIDESTLNIDPRRIEEKISKRTKAIIPVDFRGHPAPLPEVKEIADRHGIFVIEDASHSMGSSYLHGGRTHNCGDGSHADIATFSFHPVKHITTGEGGAVMTNNGEIARKVNSLSSHGLERNQTMFSEERRQGEWVYDAEELGFNYRMTDIQAALGASQLKKVNQFKARRRKIVNYYNENLDGIEELILPYEKEGVDSNFHIYVIQIKKNRYFDRYDIFSALEERCYKPMVHYIPVHLLSYYRKKYGFKLGDYPISEKYYQSAITIPLYPMLTDAQVEKVVEDIADIVRRMR
jgi:UDP-4-amino-4,6-dideoxy-N-acetyl-beta-L-altrosamine transaminase